MLAFALASTSTILGNRMTVDSDMALTRSVYANAVKRANHQPDDPALMLEAVAAWREFVNARKVARLRRLTAEIADAARDLVAVG